VTIRVLLADDQALLRATFRLLLESAPDIEVAGEASTGEEAVAGARSARADVVLMDIRMPGMDGIEATRRITADEALAGVKVLVLTTFETDDLVVEALLSPAATTALVARFLSQPRLQAPTSPGGLAELTPREREVTALVGAGLSNSEIGRSWWSSPMRPVSAPRVVRPDQLPNHSVTRSAIAFSNWSSSCRARSHWAKSPSAARSSSRRHAAVSATARYSISSASAGVR
jgi:DNA-binding NarL/FixJ family response regulator